MKKLKYVKLFEEFEQGELPPVDATNRLAKIVKLPYDVFVQKLGELADDPKFVAAMKGGVIDGNPNDEKFTFDSPKFLPVSQLIPTQKEIDVEKSLKYPLSGEYPRLTREIMEGKAVTVKGPIVTLNDKYIIDGHHRWSQVYVSNVDCKIECMNIETKQTDPLLVLKAVQIAIAASIKEVPTAVVEGGNLLEIGQDALEKYVERHLSDVTFKIMQETSPQDIVFETHEDATSYYWKNVELMQDHNKPVPGAPERDVMPQTDVDKTGGWKEEMQSGEVNFMPRFRAE